ncbi:FliH/SctL family protein [Chitinimonas sp. BJB300]|uniref:FliH/SctL family protein n=1 Tax=Chitinimonas sp. BJB300 TaxID=1559339 RepID=UPI000C0F38B4|nr:FliH/SctL family protein [Chitinimonas sp. BJB300]PHV12873.1 hypothetical protein CSQ89_03520 [Chitinimonas sp. BJB300]TSJ86095.1 hypothetical protein FG002_016320 [Chitinimonas sp. BJB300]
MAPIIRKPQVLGDKRALRPQTDDRLPHAESMQPSSTADIQPRAVAPADAVVQPVQPVPVDLRPLREEALRQAREEMQAEVEALAQAAQARGYEDGLKKAAQQLAEENAQRTASTQTLIETIEQHCQQALVHTEELAAQIAYETVCKIAGEQLITADGVLAIAQSAIATLGQQRVLKVHVSPPDFTLLKDADDSPPHSTLLEWVPDDRIKAGGCIVETVMGELDARLEVLLTKTCHTLISARASRTT